MRRAVLILAILALAAPQPASAAGNAVNVMVVGRHKTYVGHVMLLARGYMERVGKKRCKVSANTPLASLHAAARNFGFSYRVRDYGNCSARNSASSSQLFIYKVGGERNRGSDGWFYKVNDRAGTLGAANAEGPFGRSLLRTGARVLWFFCNYSKRYRTCQKSLRMRASRSARRGRPFQVRVSACNNSGRCRPAAQASVHFGRWSTKMGRKGRLSFKPRRRGTFKLRVTRKGALPSFSQYVRVS